MPPALVIYIIRIPSPEPLIIPKPIYGGPARAVHTHARSCCSHLLGREAVEVAMVTTMGEEAK
jgi:hypothetical protein